MLQTSSVKRRDKAEKKDRKNRQLPHLDGRSKASHRFKALCKNLTLDLGHEPSVAEAALIRQAAAAIVVSEIVQGRVLAGKATVSELEENTRVGNLAARCLIALGLKRKSGSNPGALDAYLDGKP